MSAWSEIKGELVKKVKELFKDAEVSEYPYYIRVKIGEKSYRILYSYGQLRILDEATKKVAITGTLDKTIETLKELIK
ncbi:MAG: hypothetical protein DRJ40_05310 [Thermoprotei archaeon]|nr:MAG: hypothetical protein DRJ40_04215 [Thermoprotei archaeon]RLE56813.1 MAG: hypothetical protein DRJ40_05310 [Thermoprotei archaeon]